MNTAAQKLDSAIDRIEKVLNEDGPIKNSSMADISKTMDRLRSALEQSVRLQAHYAELLNMRDGGQRIIFRSADEWLDRLDNMKTTKPKTKKGKSK